jgi:hypothetical protein
MGALCHLVSREHYLFKPYRERFWCTYALAGELGLDLIMTGLGWPQWDPEENIQANLSMLYGGEPELVVAYKPDEHGSDFGNLPYPTAGIFNEMWRDVELSDMFKSRNVIQHYEADRVRLQPRYGHVRPSGQWIAVRHAATPPWLSKPEDIMLIKDRPLDIVLFGALNKHAYPLRDEEYQALFELSRRGWRTRYHPHPGLQVPLAWTNWHLKDTAKVLRQSKMALACSGVHRYRFGKYSEIPATGAVLCADMPATMAPDQLALSDCMIELEPLSDVDQIVERVENALRDPGDLQRRQERGLEYAQELTVLKWAKQVAPQLRLD